MRRIPLLAEDLLASLEGVSWLFSFILHRFPSFLQISLIVKLLYVGFEIHILLIMKLMIYFVYNITTFDRCDSFLHDIEPGLWSQSRKEFLGGVGFGVGKKCTDSDPDLRA
jgi:hypothetical protein